MRDIYDDSAGSVLSFRLLKHAGQALSCRMPILWLFCSLLTVLYVAPANAQRSHGNSIPIPDQIHGEQDDRVATLWWNGFPRGGTDNPPGVYGYQIQWGLADAPPDHTSYSQKPVIQLQPLVNGKPYMAVIRAVDAYGNYSAPSGHIHFTGSSARVDALRKQMNGFFDDFNLPAGPVDELKWNMAVSYVNDPAKNGFFINDQFHVHSMLGDKHGDRGQIISRPRAPFFIGGRTGAIVFDFDGAQRRDFWYLDLVPKYIDITGQVNLDLSPGYPGDMLRIRQSGNSVRILWIDGEGKPHEVASCQDLMRYHIELVPNVRRHWKVLVSQTQVQLYIDDQQVCAGAVKIPWSVGYVHWNAFAYNNGKANEPQTLMHWDNFGFDAPQGWTSQTTVHNYLPFPSNGAEFVSLHDFAEHKFAIRIPDSLENATEARLMFAMQMGWNQWYHWDARDSVTLNGQKLLIAQPGGMPLNPNLLVNGNAPYNVVIPISPKLLRRGANVVSFAMNSSGALNLHIEVEYPKSKAPAYTQPTEVATMLNVPMSAIPDMGTTGPGVVFSVSSGET